MGRYRSISISKKIKTFGEMRFLMVCLFGRWVPRGWGMNRGLLFSADG